MGLFGAIPDIHKKTDRLNAINGLMPDPANLPTGCKFAPRCQYCTEKCKQAAPPVYEDGQHKIACHRFSKEVKE